MVDPRTGLEDIDEQECWRLLAATPVGRLAVIDGSRPDVFPVNYAVDGRTIVIRTVAGTKLVAAAAGAEVAFEIDEVDADRRVGWSVVVHGPAAEPRTLEEVVGAEDLGLEPWAEGPKDRFLVITPTSVTGRRVPPRG